MAILTQYCTRSSLYDGPFRWQAAGMGYILFSDDGHIICVDGGTCREDAEGFLTLLESHCQGIPTVDMWILSHPHGDHFGALWELSRDETLRKRVKVLSLGYAIPEKMPWESKGGTASASSDLEKVFSIAPALSCPVISLHKGDKFSYGNCRVEIYHTYEDAESLEDPNEFSMVFSLAGPEKKAMFVGDSYRSGLDVCLKNTPTKSLKSDIIQLAHHALNGGSVDFYAACDASIAFVPISLSGDRAMRRPEETCAGHNQWAMAHADTVIKAFTGTASIIV